MIAALAGRTHRVTTAWALVRGEERHEGAVTARVTFRPLTPAEVDTYVGHGESMDKAGAYGAQAHGVTLIERIDGSLTTVIGLPVPEVLAALRMLGIR
jgi:septum formation protein